MHTPDEQGHAGRQPEEIDASPGYEPTDVRVSGVVVFLTAMLIFVAVVGALAYGIGEAIDAHMAREDGKPSHWSKTVDLRSLGNMPSSPALQNKMAQLMRQFPAPRLAVDDGDQDVADLHAREALLLNHYTWVDQAQGKVRIPIERAMALIAKQGLPVAPAVGQTPLLFGDARPAVTAPLTNGFARTGYEQEQAEAQRIEAARGQ